MNEFAKEYYKQLNSWSMTTNLGKFYSKVSRKLVKYHDILKDIFTCGTSLEKYVNSIDRSISTGSESTRYISLNEMFKNVNINDNTRFIDVGCGKGRVVNFVHCLNKNCQATGIEFNSDVANYAKGWADKKENVNIINDDAFNINCDNYDVFYFNRPFMEETFEQFAEKMVNEIKHPVTVICYADAYMSKYLKGKPNWTLRKQGILYKKNILIYSFYPQFYSIFTFDSIK
ncbi:class I SAM-dependent methyltransferase [uncultured Eubacterium sp.]|uniref:class I SAM-dependent methyltransferase n=1 Tax=uncultured Eubacterium sp. TaxID=165185 RepID=UPI002584E4B1|nr:class I SAM-dependent methyltransferase [uncultured Eubacterium sp.]